MKKKIDFVIVSPHQHHGGAIVLHLLCKKISEEGFRARIYYGETGFYQYKMVNEKNSFYRISPRIYFCLKKIQRIYNILRYNLTDFSKALAVKLFGARLSKYKLFAGYSNVSVKGCKRKLCPIVGKRTIVIYPEIVYGNPLNAERVVRWFLFYNRYKGDMDAQGKDDLFFCYREIFNDWNLNPQCRKLHLSYFDLELYRRTNYGKRNGRCYIVRKGNKRDDLPDKFDGVVIDDLPENKKVQVFNECEFCISYDTQTAYSSIAAMCGCISVVVPESGKSRSDYRGSGEAAYGIAFGFDENEIEFAIRTRDKIREEYKKINQKGEDDVKQFIKICESYFEEGEQANDFI